MQPEGSVPDTSPRLTLLHAVTREVDPNYRATRMGGRSQGARHV